MAAPRILITYPFPIGRATGGARMTREIARHLGRAGAEVTILPISTDVARAVFPRPAVPREFLGEEFDQELARDSVTVERVPQHPLHSSLDAWNVRRAVARIVKRERVDLVLSYYAEAAFLPSLLRARGVGFGIISTWQSYARALDAPVRGVPRFLSRRLQLATVARPYRAADVLFATSGFTRDELVEIIGVEAERVFVCPLGVDPGFFEIPRERPEEITRLVFFGRIIPSKGVLDAIQALGKLAAAGRDRFLLRLRGQGDHAWALAAAREHGIAEKVEALGPADDAELKRELAEAHVAVLPSHFEAFGLAFAEAQAAGLPVVGYAAGSVPEVVQDGVTGWLAPLHDVDRLSELLGEALGDAERTHRAGLAARERVQREFTWERTAAVILGGLATVRGKGSSAPTAAAGGAS